MSCQLAATLKSLRQSILVIGYGNPLCSDDGVGQLIARAVAAWNMPNVDAIAVHQLTPELTERLEGADSVIFVDAYPATREHTVQVRPLEAAEVGMSAGHWCEPQVLLAMSKALWGYHPQAWWVMVPSINFELGEYLSPVAEQGMEAALHEVEYLIKVARTEPCMKLA